MAQYQPDRDWTGWQQHSDASGRVYLANPFTKETTWLWSKWALNGRVFCVNVLSNDRVWQDDMPPEVRIAAGIPPPQPPPLSSSLEHASNTTPCALAPDPERFHGSYVSYPQEELESRSRKRARVSDNGESWRIPPCDRSFGSENVPFAQSNASHQQGMKARSTSLQSHTHGVVKGSSSSPEKRASRFSAVSSVYVPDRPYPRPPVAQSIPPRRRNSSFMPVGKRAKSIVASVVSRNRAGSSCGTRDNRSWNTALLYERDIAGVISKWPPDKSATVSSIDGTPGSGAIVGTCMVEERKFLRLTSAPDPADVRPLPVLKRALRHVKRSWAKQLRDYEWVCSQLKSIRQDLQIQHIETTEALDAYETHARIALENADLGEFNTCVAQLSELYARVDRLKSVRDEFAAYRIIYNVLVGENEGEFARMLLKTPAEERERPAVKYAIRIRRAVLDGNYDAFFRLYETPPGRTMVTFLLNHMVDYMRSRALAVATSAYSPGRIPLAFVITQLAWFEDDCTIGSGSEDSLENDMVVSISSSAGASEFTVNLSRVLRFCERIGVVVEPSGKDEKVPFLINAKASKARGVAVMQNRKGLITAAGAK